MSARAAAAFLADRALALTRLQAMYDGARAGGDAKPFWQVALDALRIQVAVADRDLRGIPSRGPVVVVANHPFGGVDGIALLSELTRVRGDVRIVANDWLDAIPELRGSLVPVDVFAGRGAAARNATALRKALRWLRGGGVLAMFPAGEVASLSVRHGAVVEGAWHPAAARLAQDSGATLVPVHVHGRAGGLFHAAGLIHPRLRTLLLAREVLRARGARLTLAVGSPIPASVVTRFGSPEGLIRFARARCEVLAHRQSGLPRVPERRDWRPIAAGPSVADLRREILSRPSDARLAEASGFSVWLTTRADTPRLIEEVGRLREQAFRAVGEGTGQSSDLDGFDDHYLHLVVWRDQTSEVVGGYRIGPTDVVTAKAGVEGLYTHTLFDFGASFTERMGPALELGRSFVRPEYQREFAPLMLLWKGIGQFVAANPDYARLFGAVSISRDYSGFSRQLMMTFLRVVAPSPLASLVEPREPPRDAGPATGVARLIDDAARDLDRVDELVREAEAGQRGIPVLLRQYLKLNARLVGFNVDRAFGDALDALMVVDLRDVAPVVLQRYLGREGAIRFLDSHARAVGTGERSSLPGPFEPRPAIA